MAKSLETIAEETRGDRLRLQSLINGGMTLSQAMLKLFPNDSNRGRKVKLWKEKGLFPVPASEREIHTESSHTAIPFQVIPDTTTLDTPTKEPVTEPLETSHTINDIPDTTTLREPNTAPESVQVVTGMTTYAIPDTTTNESAPDLLALIDQRVKTQLASVLADVAQPKGRLTVGGRGKRGRTHIKVAISIPRELNDRLDQLEGAKSQHIANAIALYLDLKSGHAIKR